MREALYEATITLMDGKKITVTGTITDCTLAIHERGIWVKRANVKRVSA